MLQHPKRISLQSFHNTGVDPKFGSDRARRWQEL